MCRRAIQHGGLSFVIDIKVFKDLATEYKRAGIHGVCSHIEFSLIRLCDRHMGSIRREIPRASPVCKVREPILKACTTKFQNSHRGSQHNHTARAKGCNGNRHLVSFQSGPVHRGRGEGDGYVHLFWNNSVGDPLTLRPLEEGFRAGLEQGPTDVEGLFHDVSFLWEGQRQMGLRGQPHLRVPHDQLGGVSIVGGSARHVDQARCP